MSQRNVELPPWYGQLPSLVSLNQFSTIANLTLSQHLDKKKENELFP